MKIYFYSLGCKVNQYDTESMKEMFRAAGWTISDSPEGCQAIVVNSCTVTSVSDQKTRQAVRRFKRSVPGAVVVLTGCMPQAFPTRAMDLEAADKEAIARTRDFLFGTLGIPSTLRGIGVPDSSNFAAMAASAEKRTLGSFVPLDKDAVVSIYEDAL